MLEFFPYALLEPGPIPWPDPGSVLTLGLGAIGHIEPTVVVAFFTLLGSLVTWLITRSNNGVQADKIRSDATLAAQRSIQAGYDNLIHALETQNISLITHLDGLKKEIASLETRLGSATLQIERLERTIRDSGLDLPSYNRD